MPMGVMRMKAMENRANLRRLYPASMKVHAREMPSMPCVRNGDRHGGHRIGSSCGLRRCCYSVAMSG
jgi:hypothetical protein